MSRITKSWYKTEGGKNKKKKEKQKEKQKNQEK